MPISTGCGKIKQPPKVFCCFPSNRLELKFQAVSEKTTTKNFRRLHYFAAPYISRNFAATFATRNNSLCEKRIAVNPKSADEYVGRAAYTADEHLQRLSSDRSHNCISRCLHMCLDDLGIHIQVLSLCVVQLTPSSQSKTRGHPVHVDSTTTLATYERTNEVYLPMNKRVDNGRLPVEAEAHQSWPPTKKFKK